MAPSTNKTYRIRSHSGSGKYLNVYGNDQVSANRNVCLWSLDTSAKAQQWNVLQVSTGVYKITTAIDSSYALNYYWSNGLGNPGNCDIYPHAGNADSTVEFITDANNPDVYEIRLTRSGTDLYLTADSSSTYITDNTNVSWKARNNDWSQKWKFEDINENPDGEIVHSNCHILGYNGHGRCINIYSNNAADGNNITLYNWDNNDDQCWTLEYYGIDSGGVNTYIIKSAHTGLYLGYTGANYYGLKSCNVTDNINNAIVTLDIMDSIHNSYRIKMNINGVMHYLTPWYGTSDSGARLIWYPSLKSYDQRWKFVAGTSHPYAHSSSNYEYGWPAANTALVNDGFDGLWRQYTTEPNVTRTHKGVDLSCPYGADTCFSMFDGTVIRVNTSLSSDRGRYVEIVSDNGVSALYQHLKSVNTTNCVLNARISKGEAVGIIGGTGTNESSYGTHLHFEIKDSNNNYIDPLSYFD